MDKPDYNWVYQTLSMALRGTKMLTKKNYKAIAKLLREVKIGVAIGISTKTLIDVFETMLIDYFASDNPNFNVKKFIDACKL